MPVVFAGGEWESFGIASGAPYFETSSATYDSNFCRGSILITNGNTGYAIASLTGGPHTEIWFHSEIYRTYQTYPVRVWEMVNAAGQGILRIQTSTESLSVFQYWNGSAWVTIGNVGLGSYTKYQLDIHARIADTGGVFEVFLNGVQVAIYSGDTNLFSGAAVTQIYLGNTHNGLGSTNWSQVIVTTIEDTRAMKLSTLGPNGDGALTEWNGSYLDVDEIGTYNDGDYISSGTPNQVELFQLGDLSPTAATLDVIAFVMAGRGRKGAAGPQNIQAALRTGGTDYFSGNLPGLNPVFSSLSQTIWSTNPSTSLPWSTSDINAIQAGFKSIA